MRDDSDDIILRVPLHTLAQVVVFDDGFNKHNLAVKVICGKDLFRYGCFTRTMTADVVTTGVVTSSLKNLFVFAAVTCSSVAVKTQR